MKSDDDQVPHLIPLTLLPSVLVWARCKELLHACDGTPVCAGGKGLSLNQLLQQCKKFIMHVFGRLNLALIEGGAGQGFNPKSLSCDWKRPWMCAFDAWASCYDELQLVVVP